MVFRVLVDEEAYAFLNALDPKSQRIIKDTPNLLKENPYPHSSGDKERLHTGKKRSIYRMHSAHSFTAIYTIDSEDAIVHITHIMTIEKAHRRYGRL